MILASTTRKLFTPLTRQCASTTFPIEHDPSRVVERPAPLHNPRIDRFVRRSRVLSQFGIDDSFAFVRLEHDVQHLADRVAHGDAVGFGGEVVRVNERRGGGVGGGEGDRAARGGGEAEDHRARGLTVHLECLCSRSSRCVGREDLRMHTFGVCELAHCHTVRALFLCGGGHGGVVPESEVVAGQPEEVLWGREGCISEGGAALFELPVKRGGEVVVEVLAHVWRIVDKRDAVCGESRCRANAGEEEELRGAVGTCGEDDLFAGFEGAVGGLDALGGMSVEDNFMREGVDEDIDVLEVRDAVRDARGLALAVLPVLVEVGVATDGAGGGVGVERETSLFIRFLDERAEGVLAPGMGGFDADDGDGAGVTVELGVHVSGDVCLGLPWMFNTRLRRRVERKANLFEIGQLVLPVPGLVASEFGPLVILARRSAGP